LTKIIALHLPQFHTIPENDEWWGKGFTEWTNTKKAKPLFEGHNQPREPLNDNYYNLLDKEAIKWQVELAKKYGVHGFCYYHYWFEGKLLLEKPVEILLEEKEIDFPFCFCWANGSWTRTWNGAEKDVIMPQLYGDESDWKDHFNYLIKFFKDPRYIKVDNKPMLVLYISSAMSNGDEMIKLWNKLCIEEGFDGIYVVEEVNSHQSDYCLKNSEAYIEFEPLYTVSTLNKLSKTRLQVRAKQALRKFLGLNIVWQVYNYDSIWNKILNRRRTAKDKKVFLGAFVDWDNTARRGIDSLIFTDVTPEKFGYYLKKQIEIANDIKSEYLFINAWNEWAEGTYLEPDKKNGYKFLEQVKEAAKGNS
jgi:lipopolysaccharide biosynthesis protein